MRRIRHDANLVDGSTDIGVGGRTLGQKKGLIDVCKHGKSRFQEDRCSEGDAHKVRIKEAWTGSIDQQVWANASAKASRVNHTALL